MFVRPEVQGRRGVRRQENTLQGLRRDDPHSGRSVRQEGRHALLQVLKSAAGKAKPPADDPFDFDADETEFSDDDFGGALEDGR